MPKAYWIARVDVRDPGRYADYVAAAAPALEEFGARPLARGGAHIALEGAGRARNVILEFPSLEAAEACFRSPVYQAARAIRAEVSDAEIVIVEGVG